MEAGQLLAGPLEPPLDVQQRQRRDLFRVQVRVSVGYVLRHSRLVPLIQPERGRRRAECQQGDKQLADLRRHLHTCRVLHGGLPLSVVLE